MGRRVGRRRLRNGRMGLRARGKEEGTKDRREGGKEGGRKGGRRGLEGER